MYIFIIYFFNTFFFFFGEDGRLTYPSLVFFPPSERLFCPAKFSSDAALNRR